MEYKKESEIFKGLKRPSTTSVRPSTRQNDYNDDDDNEVETEQCAHTEWMREKNGEKINRFNLTYWNLII